MTAKELTHFDHQGQAWMVDVGAKAETKRRAVAQGQIQMNARSIELIREHQHAKGDVLGVAQIAGIMGAKRCSELIPLCHPLFLSHVSVVFTTTDHAVIATATTETVGKTGVEMEALTAVSVALLTIYDMCKAVDKTMRINGVELLEKHGGKSDYTNTKAV